MSEVWNLPKIATIVKVVQENPKVKSFFVDVALESQPGQFYMVWLPGVDEKPFVASYQGTENAFSVADAALAQKSADIMLGLYPVKDNRRMQRTDMVRFETQGRIKQIMVKPASTDLKCCWIFAIWKPDFTLFMHDYLKHDIAQRQNNSIQAEIHLGHVFQAAIENGFSVFGHLFTDFHYIDVGNPDDLAQALREYFVERS